MRHVYPSPLNLDFAVKPREIAASTDAPDYGEKVLITNKVTTNFFPTPITPLATTLSTSSTADSRLKLQRCWLFIHVTNTFYDTPIIHGAALFHHSDRAIQAADTCNGKSMAIQVMVAL